jgi:hypothetical protein
MQEQRNSNRSVVCMPKEPKGFCNDSGEVLERKNPICTKRGIIIYKGQGDDWKIEFPDSEKRYGGATTIKLMNLIYHLHKTNGNLDKSRELSIAASIKPVILNLNSLLSFVSRSLHSNA